MYELLIWVLLHYFVYWNRRTMLLFSDQYLVLNLFLVLSSVPFLLVNYVSRNWVCFNFESSYIFINLFVAHDLCLQKTLSWTLLLKLYVEHLIILGVDSQSLKSLFPNYLLELKSQSFSAYQARWVALVDFLRLLHRRLC